MTHAHVLCIPDSCTAFHRNSTRPEERASFLNFTVIMVTPEDLPGEIGGRIDPHFDLDTAPTTVDMDAAIVLLGAGVTAITHPLLYVKLLIQVG